MLIWSDEVSSESLASERAEESLSQAIARRCALEEMAPCTLRRLFEAMKNEVDSENSRCSRQMRVIGGEEFIEVLWDDRPSAAVHIDLWPEGELQFSVSFGSTKQFGSMQVNPLHTHSVSFPYGDQKRVAIPTEEAAQRLISAAAFGTPLHELRVDQRG